MFRFLHRECVLDLSICDNHVHLQIQNLVSALVHVNLHLMSQRAIGKLIGVRDSEDARSEKSARELNESIDDAAPPSTVENSVACVYCYRHRWVEACSRYWPDGVPASNNRKGNGEAENVLGVRHVLNCSHGQDDVAQKAGVDHLSHHHATPRETSIWSEIKGLAARNKHVKDGSQQPAAHLHAHITAGITHTDLVALRQQHRKRDGRVEVCARDRPDGVDHTHERGRDGKHGSLIERVLNV
mmetsp:Transcript_75417/g.122563  ORF Transcript_75417/g.122563 Transcript_75417/m.122563 type:complete len:242 (-) Transcript_75417:928-1653(-)